MFTRETKGSGVFYCEPFGRPLGCNVDSIPEDTKRYRESFLGIERQKWIGCHVTAVTDVTNSFSPQYVTVNESPRF